MLPDRVVSPRIPEEIYRRLRAEAQRQGRTPYALAREILMREGLKLPPVLLDDGEPYSAGKYRFREAG